MMLSQGQFAAFLNAKASERAELLEELTGTEIYGLISAAIYERHKEAKPSWICCAARRERWRCWIATHAPRCNSSSPI